MVASARRPAARKPSPRRRAVFTGLLDALEHVLDEGVTRATLRHLSFGEVMEWERLFALSVPVVDAARQRCSAAGAGDAWEPSLAQLVVCAAGITALARHAGVPGETSPDAPDVAALGTLRAAVDAAYRYSRQAHDRALLTAFADAAA